MTEQIKKIEEKITALIEEGKVKMKPKWFFVLKFILKTVFILVIFLIIIYFLSFVSLVIRERLALGFNPHMIGWMKFLFAVPWLIVFLSCVLVIVLEILVRKYAFVYRRPVAYTLFFSVFLIVLITLMLPKIDKRERLPRFGEDSRVPVFGPMHRFYRKDFKEREFEKFRIQRGSSNFPERMEIRFFEN